MCFFQLFTEGSCRFEGDLLNNFEGVGSASICQTFCQDLECNYFVYNGIDHNCQLRSSTGRSCDWMRGPPTPSYGDCFNPPTPTPPDISNV